VASRKIYEDEKVTAVLDINPANPGHVLLLPKQHHMIMPQLPEETLQHIGMVAKAVSHAQLRALKAQGTNIFVANGVAAGQRAQHFMLHIIPRAEGDQISFALPEKAITPDATRKIQEALKKAIAKSLGLKTPDEPETHEEEQTLHKDEPAENHKETAEKPARKKAEAKKQKPAKEQQAGKGANLDDIASLLTGGR
jgi:histidine triad (HIT) family protein